MICAFDAHDESFYDPEYAQCDLCGHPNRDLPKGLELAKQALRQRLADRRATFKSRYAWR